MIYKPTSGQAAHLNQNRVVVTIVKCIGALIPGVKCDGGVGCVCDSVTRKLRMNMA